MTKEEEGDRDLNRTAAVDQMDNGPAPSLAGHHVPMKDDGTSSQDFDV
jgi:hypothetical protein